MFPTASRPALFANLRLRKDHEFAGYVPAFRLLYGKPARIFLVRREGEFRMPRLNLATSDDPGECDDTGENEIAYVGDLVTTGAGEIHEGDLLITPETAAVVDEAVRRWRGWDMIGAPGAAKKDCVCDVVHLDCRQTHFGGRGRPLETKRALGQVVVGDLGLMKAAREGFPRKNHRLHGSSGRLR